MRAAIQKWLLTFQCQVIDNDSLLCARRLPCDKTSGKLLFAKPCGDEGWVLLLEKAVAKFKVS
jgi:hypothetical protein